MPSIYTAALMAGKDASHLVLEVDELHVPHVADNLNPQALVLLNLTRDQLDRVGEINKTNSTSCVMRTISSQSHENLISAVVTVSEKGV